VGLTKEEIKATVTMDEVIARFGFKKNKRGYIECPFHNEKTASMKIYKDSYYCFGCGSSGDIFTLVQKLDNLTFDEAFKELGGIHENNFFAKINIDKARRERNKLEIKKQKKQAKKELNCLLITVYRKWLSKYEPLSDEWTVCYNNLQKQLYLCEILND
jgi:DNA primase